MNTLRAGEVAVLLGGHSGDTLEVAVEGGRFRKAEHVGDLAERALWFDVDEALGMRYYEVFDTVRGGFSACFLSDKF